MSLVDAILAEMTRVRDHVMPAYLEVGRVGRVGEFALTRMRAELDVAAKALAYQDVTRCLQFLESLKGYTT